MRVLTLNYEYPPLGGGAAPVTRDLAANVAARGHDVDVVTMGFDGLPARETDRGVTVHRVPALRESQSMSRSHEMLSFIPTGLARARRLLVEHDHDIVHSHFILPTGIVASVLNAVYDVPYVVTAHGSDVPGYNPDRFTRLHRAVRPVWRRVVANAELIASPSTYLEGLIHTQHADAAVEVIPNGFEYETYDPDREKTDRILVASRLFERKGVQYFLDALAELETDWTVVVTGDGPYRESLERRANRLDVDVTFTGWVERSTLTDLLETSEVYVFPSSHENCPVALQEAMAAGTAIVASKFSGTREVIGDAGLVVDPHDTEAFAAALEALLSNPDERSALQDRARARIADRFDWDRIVDRYETVYETHQ